MVLKNIFMNFLESDHKKIEKIFFFTIFFFFFIQIYYNLSWFIERFLIDDRTLFWDLKTIYKALVAYSQNNFTYLINPYDYEYAFPYPPFLLKSLSAFGKFPFDLFLIFYLFLSSISLVFYFLYCYKKFQPISYYFLYPLILFFSFGASLGITGLFSGNFSLIMYGLISLGLITLKKNKLFFYYLVIIFCSLIKIYFMIFFLIPFFLYGFKSIKYIFFSVITVLLINLLSYFDDPTLYNDYLKFISIQAAKYPNQPWASFGISGILTSFYSELEINNVNNIDFNNLSFSFLLNFIIILIITLLVVSTYFITSFLKKNFDTNTIFCLTILGITISFPRLVPYDLFLVIPAIYYLINNTKLSNNLRINLFLKLILLIFFLLVQDAHAAICTISLLFFIFSVKVLKFN